MARPRSFDEDEVLLVAQDHFWSTGYAAARVDDIAAATGLGKGSLYGAFGDKHQLFLRVFDDYCAAVTEAVRQALDGPDAGAYERLRVHVLAVADATRVPAWLPARQGHRRAGGARSGRRGEGPPNVRSH
jgi:AcrR family transcriptional regulator